MHSRLHRRADTASSLYADVCRENRPVQRSLTKQHFTCSLTLHDQAARPSTQAGNDADTGAVRGARSGVLLKMEVGIRKGARQRA